MLAKRRLRIGFGVEPVSRIEEVVALEAIYGAVQIICSRLDSDVDRHTWLPADVWRRIFFGIELLNGIDRQDRTGCALHALCIDDVPGIIGIVVVAALDHEIVILRPHTVGNDGFETAAREANHSRPENYEILIVATVERQVVDFFIRKSAAD